VDLTELIMPKRKTTDKDYQELIQDIDLQSLHANVRAFFSKFPDPRVRWIYPAWHLILVILCGYLAGCDTIADIAHFAEMRNGWLNTTLGLNFSPVSYDTIWWFLVRVKPDAFKNLMSQWLNALPSNLRDQLLAIDGKRLRGISDSEHITHLVELFAVDSRIVITQERVHDKACERDALPKLLETVDITGAIVSLDAHYTYIPTLNLILEQGADFLVGIKGNQGNLEAEVSNYFNQAYEIGYDSEEFKCHTTIEKEHGRIETRHICITNDLDWLEQKDAWHLKSLVEVRSERVLKDKVEKSIRYYGSSREGTSKQFADWIRDHWGIENRLHYVADVVFKEDAAHANTGHAAENMSLFRRLAMNIVATVDPKRGMADARRNAAYEPAYLRGLLSRLFTGKC
jgi:predicted transposase YbfD/YdcC